MNEQNKIQNAGGKDDANESVTEKTLDNKNETTLRGEEFQ